MTYTTTARADTRTALKTALDAFKAANPSIVSQTYSARPRSLTPPSVFIGHWSERIALDAQIATRLPLLEVWLIEGTYDNAEDMGRADVLADAFISYFGDGSHSRIGNDTVILGMETDDREVTLGGANGAQATYLATVVTLQLDIQQGGI